MQRATLSELPIPHGNTIPETRPHIGLSGPTHAVSLSMPAEVALFQPNHARAIARAACSRAREPDLDILRVTTVMPSRCAIDPPSIQGGCLLLVHDTISIHYGAEMLLHLSNPLGQVGG